jgi:hypothetical protein
MTSVEYATWYDSVFRVALKMVSSRLPRNLRAAYIQADQELPASYQSAEAQAVGSTKGGRVFTGNKMTPELLNHLLPMMREIVDRKPSLSKFRGFFFHIYGINLKTVGQGLDGREGGNMLRHIFNTYPVVDWDKQNPQDIVVDFGVEITVDPNHLPGDIDEVTLLWNYPVVSSIVSKTWQSPRMDSYMHSDVIAGLRCQSYAPCQRTGLIKFQCYHKDSKQTYVHGDRSIGTGFSPENAASGSQVFYNEMRRLGQVWSRLGTYGVRAEWRCTAWPIAILQQQDPQGWVRAFFGGGAIVRLLVVHHFSWKLSVSTAGSASQP